MSDIRSITYEGAKALTLSDTTADPQGPFAAIFSGAGGSIKLRTLQNDDVTFTNVPAGVFLDIACSRVWSTGTTATNLLGMVAAPYLARASAP